MASNNGRGNEKSARDEEHDDRLVAESGEKIESLKRHRSGFQLGRVHEKKSAHVPNHNGASRDSADQVERLRRGFGTV